LPISTGRGSEPAWSRDGSELFYRDGDKMLAVEIATEPTFTAGRPRVLFEGSYAGSPGAGLANYDVSRDGRFLMLVPEDRGAGTETIIVVKNWFEELKARVPTP